jgi:protein involved in polysaccharide export with SLBB domain
MICASSAVLTARLEPSKSSPQPPGAESKKEVAPAVPVPPPEAEKKRLEVKAAIDKLFEAYDLKPHALPAVPDNPPPHEGAMIDYPLVIEPPDLLLVEVLEALPGRPISGERLVRPDGTVNLGFYGDVHVAGLTVEQAKVKIIKHLRKLIRDESLGLIESDMDEPVEEPAGPESKDRTRIPVRPGPDEKNPFDLDEGKRPREQAKKPHTVPSAYRPRAVRQASQQGAPSSGSRPGERVRPIARRQDQEEKKPDQAQKQVKIPVEAGGQVNITIEVHSKEKKEEVQAPVAEETSLGPPIPPEKSERVFADITAYNSKNYYVLGDVAQPGKLPFTGRETVLDAIQYGGGLLPTAEPKDIHLIRPARGGKPARVYKVDLEAIYDRGDVTSNYQIFPGDRLVVGRNDVVKKTIQMDRLSAAMYDVSNAIMYDAVMLRALQAYSPEKKDAILKDLVEFWIQEMRRPEGAKFDEQTLRDALIKRLQIKP